MTRGRETSVSSEAGDSAWRGLCLLRCAAHHFRAFCTGLSSTSPLLCTESLSGSWPRISLHAGARSASRNSSCGFVRVPSSQVETCDAGRIRRAMLVFPTGTVQVYLGGAFRSPCLTRRRRYSLQARRYASRDRRKSRPAVPALDRNHTYGAAVPPVSPFPSR